MRASVVLNRATPYRRMVARTGGKSRVRSGEGLARIDKDLMAGKINRRVTAVHLDPPCDPWPKGQGPSGGLFERKTAREPYIAVRTN